MQESEVNNPSSKPPKEQVKTSKAFRIKWDSVWKLFFFILLALVAFVINKVVIFQTHDTFKDVRKGAPIDFLFYSLPAGIIFGVLEWLVHYYFDPIFVKHYVNDVKYPKLQDQLKKSYTCVKWAFSIFYYIFFSAWCYNILRKTSFLPTYLGGQGDPFKVLNDPRTFDAQFSFQMKLYYLIQFGKHSARLFIHVFIRPQGNFFEYSLHHGLSVFLVGYSYLTNMWLIGCMVFFLHDYSDFALILARVYREYKNKNQTLLSIIYVHAFSFWVAFRIVIFITACILPALYTALDDFPNLSEFQISVMRYPYYLMISMMMMLEVLQIFWTYFITESFISVKVSNKVVHSYD